MEPIRVIVCCSRRTAGHPSRFNQSEPSFGPPSTKFEMLLVLPTSRTDKPRNFTVTSVSRGKTAVTNARCDSCNRRRAFTVVVSDPPEEFFTAYYLPSSFTAVQISNTMLSSDSGQGESIICTPRSISKRLFGAGSGSSKRSLFSEGSQHSRDTEMSGEESDLGPMSPLAMTDPSESSCDSSPGHHFVSPLTTPEKSLKNLELKTWDRLRLSSAKKKVSSSLSPFSSLKMSTQAARWSPKRKILQDSPKSLPLTPKRKELRDSLMSTPEREIAHLFEIVVPETPQKDLSDREDSDRVEETPQKDEGPEQRLITPLGSVLKQIVVPPLNRRKSLCSFDKEETFSSERKENLLKRHANDSPPFSTVKFPKLDENSSIPKARASLFREKESSPTSTIEFTLSAKSFYKSAGKRGRSTGPDWRDPNPTKKRHSLPLYSNNQHNSHQRRSARRSKREEMNAGVRHGIKRPKTRRHVSRIDAFKKDSQKVDPASKTYSVEGKEEKIKKVEKVTEIDSKNDPPAGFSFSKIERTPFPIADPNKRFFKTNRTLKSHHVATVTVNNNIKLKVSDGKIALNEKHSKNPRKKPRLEEMSFDATDLTVDDAVFDTSIDKRNVDGILKILENDWADDDYDTMETLTAISPVKHINNVVSGNVLMSPASVLSNMTSSMNIEDAGNVGRRMDIEGAQEEKEEGKKFFPLFAKGYSSNAADKNAAGKLTCKGTKRNWQTSMKGGCGGAEDQYQIDAGQKRFGATNCTECGVVYQLGDPEDENAHLNFHNSYKNLKFNGWKKERVIMTDPFTNSRIISIEPGDPKLCWKKVAEVLAVVDRDLGLAEMELSCYLDKKVYFYVRDKTILGVMVVESIKTAHRMIPELVELDCCSDKETPAKCGVNVIWTAMSHRRQRIATKLLDTVRATYFFGYIMPIDDVAFSMPTPTGKIFAEKYTKTRSFKVYN